MEIQYMKSMPTTIMTNLIIWWAQEYCSAVTFWFLTLKFFVICFVKHRKDITDFVHTYFENFSSLTFLSCAWISREKFQQSQWKYPPPKNLVKNWLESKGFCLNCLKKYEGRSSDLRLRNKNSNHPLPNAKILVSFRVPSH